MLLRESFMLAQEGEDGILSQALSLLPDRNQWCIEFGAWDGKHLSNTYDLVDRQGYRAVLIEADPVKYRELCSTYPHKDRAILIDRYVGWGSDDNLNRLLEPHPAPRDPDLLSIDVDGNDFHIWRALKGGLKPKLVVIEYNPTTANGVVFAQPAAPEYNQGSSSAALVRLGKELGYELIATTSLNLVFVDRSYFDLFGIEDNSLDALRDDHPTYLFVGYDGTVFLQGEASLLWHGVRISSEDVQILPPFLRKQTTFYNWLQRIAFKAFRIARRI